MTGDLARRTRLVAGLMLALLPSGAAHAASRHDVPDLPFIRTSFARAVDDAAAAEALSGYIERSYGLHPDSFPPVVHAYYASLEGLRGKRASDLAAKLGHVRNAIALFRGLVEASPENVEIRFLRFAFFSQLPFFFGVQPTASIDLAVLVQRLSERADDGIPAELASSMAAWLLANAELDRGRRERLQRLVDPASGAGRPPVLTHLSSLSPRPRFETR